MLKYAATLGACMLIICLFTGGSFAQKREKILAEPVQGRFNCSNIITLKEKKKKEHRLTIQSIMLI